MKALVVYCHPNPESFNHAILETVTGVLDAKGMEYRVKDLYQMNWNPVLSVSDLEKRNFGQANPDVEQERSDIHWADQLIFIFPIWWEDRPALLKGWYDRVFAKGFGYKTTSNGSEGLLSAKKTLVITTSGHKQQASTFMGNLKKCGIEDVIYKNYVGVATVSQEQRIRYLEEIKSFL